MNSKLPPKYTILFLLLFISIANKGQISSSNDVELYPASLATTGKAYFISTLPSIVSDYSSTPKLDASSDLESYKWYLDIKGYIHC
jgi:hypothetical protein